MDSESSAPTRTVLILKSDRLYAEVLRQLVLRVFSQADVAITSTIDAAKRVLDRHPVDLLVTGLAPALDGDALELLAACTGKASRVRQVMVVTARREYRVLAALRTLGVNAVFDSATESPEAFLHALSNVGKGTRYWSPAILDHMHRVGSPSNALFRLLTVFEQVVLSVVGDGCDDGVAARELGLSPATVSTVRRELHRKLGVQHRGELVRVAAQNGFVHFTPNGVVRPGYTLLSAAYHARRTKRSDHVVPSDNPVGRSE